MSITNDPAVMILDYLKNIGKTVEVSTELFTSGILDSLDIIDLVLFLEEKYHIKIPQKSMTLDNFKTPSSIAQLVQTIL